MVMVSWDIDGVMHINFLEAGITLKLKNYNATFKTLKQRLSGVWKHKHENFVAAQH